MHIFRRLLDHIPTLDEIEAEASARFPDAPERADAFARGRLAGYYHTMRLMIAELVGPDDDDDDEDDTEDFDHGGESWNDPEACDVGRTFTPSADATRREVRMP